MFNLHITVVVGDNCLTASDGGSPETEAAVVVDGVVHLGQQDKVLGRVDGVVHLGQQDKVLGRVDGVVNLGQQDKVPGRVDGVVHLG